MKKPNILWITSDQQHWDTLGAFNSEVSTPNLDRLINEGMTFTRAYCPNPTCTPTRSSLITGMYPSQHGAWSLGTKLREDVPTIGDLLRDKGYRSALIGKAHFSPRGSTEENPSLESADKFRDLEFWKNYNDPYYGFEHIELTRNHTNRAGVGMHYLMWLKENGCDNWQDYFKPPAGTMDSKKEKWKWIPEEFHYDKWIAERTNAMLEEYKENDENFFLWASFFDPHPPYYVSEPYDTMYDPEKVTLPEVVPGEHDKNPPHFGLTQKENPDFSAYDEDAYPALAMKSHLHDKEEMKKNIAVYYGMITMMDKYIGKILDKLDELGLSDNTMIMFTSDHGHVYGHHGLKNKGPFHYEDLLRVPLIARYPGQIPAGKVTDALQSLVDITPTFLSMTGHNAPLSMAGKDQSDVWRGKQERIRDHVVVEYRHQPTAMFLKSYVNQRYKLTVYYNREYGELFDLEEDPEELHNLWDDPKYKELKAELMHKFLWAEFETEPLYMERVSST